MSDLERVARDLVACLTEAARVADELNAVARRAEGHAAVAARGSVHAPGLGRVAAMLREAARDCRGAAQSLDRARRTGTAWARGVASGGSGSSTAARAGSRPALTVPQGLTAEQFSTAATTLRAGTAGIGGELVVQGSRAAGTAGPGSDIDFGIRVSPQRFDELISERFGTPNPGSAKERTMEWAVRTGKIQAGEAGLGRVRRSLAAQLGMKVDLSVIRRGGPFDNPPFIGVP